MMSTDLNVSTVLYKGKNSKVEKLASGVVVKTFSKVANRSAVAEIAILKYLNHPNVMNLLKADFIDKIWKIYMPFRGKSLSPGWKSSLKNSSTAVITIGSDIAEALHYLHKNLVSHCDVKHDNVLFDAEESIATLCDFGLSTYDPPELLSSSIQTYTYRAPEVDFFSDKSYYNYSIDVWGYGCLLYYLLTDELFVKTQSDDSIKCVCVAFGMNSENTSRIVDLVRLVSMTHKQINDKINDRINKTQTMEIDNGATARFIDIITRCLTPNVNLRILSEDIDNEFDKIRQLFNFNPSNKNISVRVPLYKSLNFEQIDAKIQEMTEENETAIVDQDQRDGILAWESDVISKLDPFVLAWMRLLEYEFYSLANCKKENGSTNAQITTSVCMNLIAKISNRQNISKEILSEFQCDDLLERYTSEMFENIHCNGIL